MPHHYTQISLYSSLSLPYFSLTPNGVSVLSPLPSPLPISELPFFFYQQSSSSSSTVEELGFVAQCVNQLEVEDKLLFLAYPQPLSEPKPVGKETTSPHLCCVFPSILSYFVRGYQIGVIPSTMSIKIKGLYKGFKCITQIFVVKDREIEIGYPTDVKHVAHIGWDGPSGSAPSWMNEFKTVTDFAASTIGNINESRGSSSLSPWSSQDYDTIERQPASDMLTDIPRTDPPPNIPKPRRKKKSASSPRSSPSSSRSSKAAKPKTKFVDNNNMKTANVEVV